MYGEEAAYLPLELFYETIVPLIGMENAVLIMISSPVGHFNYFSKLMQLKNPITKKPMFDVVDMELVCSSCRKTTHPEKCRHMFKYIPPWKSVKSMDIVAAIYGDRVTTLLRESMGVVTDGNSGFFPKEDIEFLFTTQDELEFPTNTPIYDVVVTCDPNAHDSATSSEMALMATVYSSGTQWIIGVDSHKAGTAVHVIDFVHAFLEAIIKDPRFMDARIIFCSEKNMGHEACFISQYVVEHFRNVIIVSKDGDVDYGLYSSHVSKVQQAYITWEAMRRHTIKFAKNWICTNPFLDDNIDKCAYTKTKLHEQLSRYKSFELTVDSVGGRMNKQVVSGKADDSGKIIKNYTDDLAFNFCYNLWLIEQILGKYLPNIQFTNKKIYAPPLKRPRYS